MSYNVVVAEDHEKIRKKLVTFLRENGFTIMAEAKSGKEAKNHVQKLRPQVLFVDIEMPDGDGYTIAKQLRLQMPDLLIVFITGKAEFASRAFDIEATDYIVKPFSQERLYQCFKRIENSIGITETQSFPRLSIRSRNSVEVIDQEEIVFISSENKSTKIIMDGKKEIRTLEYLKNLEEKLDSALFLRTHKSYIINIKHISRIEPSGQTYIVYFKNTSKMAFVSRTHLSSLYKRLQIS
ncbi:LytR/AlgR family response regulator transcription factor [Metabacillus arenae]|uniref:Response regulator transcription factor n=1 Tax=Metabacillus arenae TaxID=2771434 RepID=A0A926NFN1_9BACI|nr:LytTR family DNA-binding domain-containing protein [Metabacillus arenae]MBD1382604.1 response regulator transcription factor [Metabacillus arenae]